MILFNKIKLICFLGLVILLGTFLTSCNEISVGNEFLSKPPTIDYTVDSVFTSKQNAQELLYNTYATLPYGHQEWSGSSPVAPRSYLNRRPTTAAITDQAIDHVGFTPLRRFWYPGNANASETGGYYKFEDGMQWKAFYQAYTIIENVDKVPDMTQDEKDRMKAEARAIIGLHYTQMFRFYGGVPWIDHAYRPDENLDIPRLTAIASVDSISAILDKAIADLPLDANGYNSVATDKGRMTKAGAAGLKTRLLLFAASPLMNNSQPYKVGEASNKEMVWMGEYKPELWTRARDAAKQTIDFINQSGHYGMVQPANTDSASYRAAYKQGIMDRGSGESLISTRYTYQLGKPPWETFWTFLVQFPWSRIDVPTHTYAQYFPDENGVPIEDSPLYDSEYPYQNRDPRFYETLTSNASMWGNRPAEMWIGGRERKTEDFGMATGGYFLRKFIYDGTEIQNSTLHWPYLRVPEIYLSYAEALNEVNGGPTQEAFDYVNRVRNRVGLNDIQTIMDNTSSKEEFNKLLLRERVLEFGFEDVRFFDMTRRKRIDLFTKELIGLNLYEDASKPSGFRYDTYSMTDEISIVWKESWDSKWFLHWFPDEEINKDYGMVQNPGWEITDN